MLEERSQALISLYVSGIDNPRESLSEPLEPLSFSSSFPFHQLGGYQQRFR